MLATIRQHLLDSPMIQALLDDTDLAGRVFPRHSQTDIYEGPKPYLVFGLGNSSDEELADAFDHIAERQYFTVWVYDEGGSYDLINDLVWAVRFTLQDMVDPGHFVISTRWLETSEEYRNETTGYLFRYARFQSMLAKGRTQQ